MEEFSDCINQLIENRIESTNDEIAKEAWYQELQDQLVVLQKGQPRETKALISKNNEINYEIFQRTMMKIYRQGFIDGMQSGFIMAPKMAPK